MSTSVHEKPAVESQRVSFEQRRELLATEVSRQLGFGNRRLESYSDLSAVIVIGKPVNHLLHFLVMVMTVGIWGLVWLLLVLTGGERRELVRVDDSGRVTVEQLGS